MVDAEGARQYRLLRDRLRPLGVRNQVVVAYQASATYSLRREIDVAPREPGSFATFGELDRDCLIHAVRSRSRTTWRSYPLPERVAKRYYLDGIRGRLLDGQHQPNPPCVALGAHLRLFPNGDVPTCQFNTHRVGNLRDHPVPGAVGRRRGRPPARLGPPLPGLLGGVRGGAQCPLQR